MSRVLLSALVCGASALLAAPAAAQSIGTELPLSLVNDGEIKIDGVLREWDSTVPLSRVIDGTNTGAQMRAALAYDTQYLYVAGEVIDRSFVRTASFGTNEDRAELVLAFPEADGTYRTVYELGLYAGQPGRWAGQVKATGLGVVRSASIVEAPAQGGYTFEARIPWNLFPPAAKTRVGLRGAVRYYDAGRSGVQCVLSTADKGRASALPLLPTAPELSLREGFVRQKGLGAPQLERLVNVAGDAMLERVMLYDRYLVVLGPGFRKGAEYFWSDLGVDVAAGDLPLFDVRDVTGDGKAEFVARKRFRRGDGWREMFQVLGFGSGDTLEPLFEHETALGSSIGSIENNVEIVPAGRGARIKVSLGQSSGYNARNFREATERDREPMLLPWGTVRSRTFSWNGTQFEQTSQEDKEPGDGTEAGTADMQPDVAAPPPPRPPTPEELLTAVFDMYKREHNIEPSSTPTFDFVTNVAEDERPERIVCHGRDLVVFGKGFREGRGYVSLSMPQFARASDIRDVTAWDLTGDGHADIIVRGEQRVQAPPELGTGELRREVLFVYVVSPEGIKRVFATETALAMDSNRIQSSVAFVPGARGLDIELRPGRSKGWQRSTWPYRQDTEAVSGVEPLVLPWTASPVRYRYDGSHFQR